MKWKCKLHWCSKCQKIVVSLIGLRIIPREEFYLFIFYLIFEKLLGQLVIVLFNRLVKGWPNNIPGRKHSSQIQV